MTKDFLDWRIYNNTNVNYRTKFLYHGTNLQAYSVYSISPDLKYAYLTSLAFETPEAGKVLLKKVLSDPDLRKVGYLTYFGNSSNPLVKETMHLLRKFGLRYAATPTFIVIKNLKYPKTDHITDIANWFIDGLWTEGFDV